MLAEAPVPLAESAEVTELTVFFWLPRAVPVTFTENVQDAPAFSCAPLSEMLFDPAAAVIVPPPQLPFRPFGLDTARPAGRPSENPIPLSDALEFGFASLNVSEVEAFRERVGAPNEIAIVGAVLAGGGGGPPLELPPPPPQPASEMESTATKGIRPANEKPWLALLDVPAVRVELLKGIYSRTSNYENDYIKGPQWPAVKYFLKVSSERTVTSEAIAASELPLPWIPESPAALRSARFLPAMQARWNSGAALQTLCALIHHVTAGSL